LVVNGKVVRLIRHIANVDDGSIMNRSLPQKIAGVFVSGPGKRGDLILSDQVPGRFPKEQGTSQLKTFVMRNDRS
jgi:hypothetical protein